jgi:hypothetical protein
VKVKILIFIPLFLFADYYISIQLSSNNAILQQYTLNCSKALTVSDADEKFIFKIKIDEKDINSLCKKEKDKIILNLLKYKSYIYSNNYYSKITFIPKRFDIIIKNGFAYFYLKE